MSSKATCILKQISQNLHPYKKKNPISLWKVLIYKASFTIDHNQAPDKNYR